MQELNLADNNKFFEDDGQNQSSTQYTWSKENVRVLLEVEVIESLYAAMSRENENSIDRSGVIEVTIIRPETADSFINLPENSVAFSTLEERDERINELQNRAEAHRRSATCATDQYRIPHLDRRQKNTFFAKNLSDDPAINVGEIVGDLPSKVTLKPRIVVPENNVKLRHGDHCDSLNSDPEIPCVEIDRRNVAAGLLKSYVNFRNSESKMRGTLSCVNPLVYHVHLESEATQQDQPLVELSAAQKILEVYEQDESSGFNARSKIIEAMRKTLAEWGSDEKRIADTLCNDTSSLTRCEHCGVISFKKEQIPIPKIGDKFSTNVQPLHCGDDEECCLTGNTQGGFCDISSFNGNDQMPQNHSNENVPKSKSSMSITENGTTQLHEPGIEKRPEKSSRIKFDSPYHEPDTKLLLRRSTNGGNIDAPLAVDTMTAERDSNSMCENTMKMIDVGQNKELKSDMLPLVTTDSYGRCLLSVEKNEKSNDARFRNTYSTWYSTRYSPRQIIPKGFKKPVQNTYRDNQNRDNIGTGNSRTKTERKYSTLVGKDCKESKAPICNNADNNNVTGVPGKPKTNPIAKCKTFSVQDSSRKNKLTGLLGPSSYIPTKLENTSSIKPLSSKNLANYTVRDKPYAIARKERTLLRIDGEPSVTRKGQQNLILSKNNESELQAKAHSLLRKKRTLQGGGIRKESQNHHANSNNPTKNLHRCFTVYSDDKVSTDQEYPSSNQLSNGGNDQRSFHSTKNRKLNQINPDFNNSAPMIGLGRKSFGNEDGYLHADDSLPVQYNAESETTAFSSSSSENVIREWANSFSPVPRFHCEGLDDGRSSCDAIRNIKVQIEKAIEKCSNYNAVASTKKIHSHETLTNTDNSLELDQKNVFPDLDYTTKQCGRFNDKNCHHFSANEAMSLINAAQPAVYLQLEIDGRTRGLEDNSCIALTADTKMEGKRFEPMEASEEIFLGKQKHLAIRTPVANAFADRKSSLDRLKMTYKNPTSVISSSSEYSSEYHQEHGVQQRYSCKVEGGSVLQLNESETFERQIKYDEFLSKDVHNGSKENMKAKALPVYRKILESNDEMDWETFQQLVGTLHPSQKELWCDICKAVSNEAKRVSGETGASTEVCIEINPVQISSQSFPCEERRSRVETSGNEISFEMDMILTDSETFLNESKETLYESQNCH